MPPAADPLPSETPDYSRDLIIRCGFEFCYEASMATPALLVLKPQLDAGQSIESEAFSIEPRIAVGEFEDRFGNLAERILLPPGRTTIRHDMFIRSPSAPENRGIEQQAAPVNELPAEVLRYTLPSRYCDSDKLMDFAYEHFGRIPHGLDRVQAICDWVHENIEYRWGAGSSLDSASEVIAQGFGVCRDFAHTAISLCRCFNLPARYITGYVPDIAWADRGSPMDFHAYFQVYIGQSWRTFDARFNCARTGRVRIACGLDAVDGAFSTLYGAAFLSWFHVWAYQVDPAEVRLGDPIDMGKRLDGTVKLRFPA